MIRVGQRLKEVRLAKHLSLEDVAKHTKIRASFLSAIERGEYHKLPSSSYAQGFVRNYAEYLGLPVNEIMALFRREFDEEKSFRVIPEGFVKEDGLPVRKIKFHQSILLVIAALVLLGGFLLFQYRAAFIDPKLIVESPKENDITSTDVKVTGESDPNATVTVNNTPVILTKQGKFTKQIAVFPGKATVVIRAVNTFGRESIIERTIEVRTTP